MNDHTYFLRSPHDDIAVVRPVGYLDLSTADDLRLALYDATFEPTSRVILELSETSFLDSVSIGVVVGARNHLVEDGGWLRIAGADPRPNAS
ncbi:anti-anti-sigma factor [Marmoricola sp. OAE513]|uniref:STAS domain-containing protein n=1 Tax=Marmoricola sp. OAE513 TaxID=2817894 RepID=UPI001AE8AFF5